MHLEGNIDFTQLGGQRLLMLIVGLSVSCRRFSLLGMGAFLATKDYHPGHVPVSKSFKGVRNENSAHHDMC
jgi:hypothetical protein